ncbi:MAG: ATP-binding protein [Phycisphaerales bacterium]
MTQDEAKKLTHYLLTLGRETEWVEFKHNNADPDRIGEYVSALANSATIAEQQHGYALWGVDDSTNTAVGTTFDPSTCKKGNQPLDIAIAAQLNPRTHFSFTTFELDGHRMVLMQVDSASDRPVTYRGTAYVRIGESKTQLGGHPDREKKLWLATQKNPIELHHAVTSLDDHEVLGLIDYPKYFDLIGSRLPDNRDGILQSLEAEGIIKHEPSGWAILTFGALLFAKSLKEFGSLARKGIRVIIYQGDDRVTIKRQQTGNRGYATGFEGLIRYISDQLPETVEIGPALRKSTPTLPEVAIRELVANALIHQDLSVTGAGPMIEIFASRIELTNPGEPLVPIQRFADMPPRSRNERTASLMRRMGMCEELGSGIDRVLMLVEAGQLPAPDFQVLDGNTRVTLFAAKSFAAMSKQERVRACYWHAVTRYLRREQMTNSSLRDRFGVAEKNYSQISRVISDSVEERMIRRDPPEDTSKRHAKYVPAWA